MSPIDIVTIAVYTYNSAAFVLETLDSIKAQTYPFLNLIVADDCSTDNTVSLCEDWIKKNSSRFNKTKVIVPDHNTGVSANFNRGWDACETEYLKDIAGDDILLPNCIEDNMNYVAEHPDAIFVFSKLNVFGTTKDEELQKYDFSYSYNFLKLNPQEQKEKLHQTNYLLAPVVFTNVKEARKSGLRHDERITMIEDYPLWLQAVDKGIRFHFSNSITVNYRVSASSLSFSKIPSKKYLESHRLIKLLYNTNYSQNTDDLVFDIFEYERDLISKYIDSKHEIVSLLNSRSYKLGKTLLSPLVKIKGLIKSTLHI